MNGLLGNPEELRKLMEQRGLFSAPPEMQPALMAQLLQQGLLQQQPSALTNFSNALVNAAKAFNPMPPRHTAKPGMWGNNVSGGTRG